MIIDNVRQVAALRIVIESIIKAANRINDTKYEFISISDGCIFSESTKKAVIILDSDENNIREYYKKTNSDIISEFLHDLSNMNTSFSKIKFMDFIDKNKKDIIKLTTEKNKFTFYTSDDKFSSEKYDATKRNIEMIDMADYFYDNEVKFKNNVDISTEDFNKVLYKGSKKLDIHSGQYTLSLFHTYMPIFSMKDDIQLKVYFDDVSDQIYDAYLVCDHYFMCTIWCYTLLKI